MSNAIAHIGKSRKFLRIADGCDALSSGITANDIDTWQLISNGTIYYEEAMFEKGGSAEIEGVIFRETKGTGALQKPNCLILFFRYSDISTAQGTDFAWTAGTTKAELVAEIEIESADWREYYDSGVVESAIAPKVLTKPVPVKADEDWQRLFAVIVSLEITAVNYTANTELDLEIIIGQD